MDFTFNKDIVITPVNNGWVVTMPVTEKSPIIGQMQDFIEGLKEDKGDLSSLLRKTGVSRSEEDPRLKRQGNVHVFVRFADVLSFLKTQITE